MSSTSNRKFNNQGERAFITTQSVKKLKKHLKEWALSKEGWRLEGVSKTFDLSKIEDSEELKDTYKEYQQQIREKQVERAVKLIEKRPANLKKHRQIDYRRFISKTNVTPDGELQGRPLR